MEHAWRQWEPQIIYVQHQSSPFPTRIWLPPFAEPIASHAPFLMSREVNTIGMAIAQGLEERGQVGATHMGTGYDAWYAGYIDYTTARSYLASSDRAFGDLTCAFGDNGQSCMGGFGNAPVKQD